MLAKILRKYNFDLVHVSGGCWQSKGIFAAKLARIKVIWELNDTYSPIFIRNIFFFLSHLANGFIFASEKTKDYYNKLVPIDRKSFIIQSPVDTTFFNPYLKFPKEKSINKIIKKKKIIIGTVSNINPVKNLEMFIKAAKKLSFYSDKIVFIVIGNIYSTQNEYFKKLNGLIKELSIKNFFFLKYIEDVRPLLKLINIYVCTSRYESSPLSVWEAMSMEKAIVSTDVGDIKKFINNGNNGLVVRVGNDKKLAKGKFPFNPNGSQNSCAGCVSSNGRHLAMMPHPERTFLEWQWPDYEGNDIHNWTPWIKLFTNAYKWLTDK